MQINTHCYPERNNLTWIYLSKWQGLMIDSATLIFLYKKTNTNRYGKQYTNYS